MSNDFIAGCVIASIIVFLFTGLWASEDYSKGLEKKYDEVYRITQEMRKKIIELAEENDYFVKHFDKYNIDDFHTSAAFEEILSDFENDIEDIGW